MKKIILSIAAFALLAISIISCGSKSDPKDVAAKFTTALNNLDYETAKKLGTPETGKMLDMISSFSSMMPDSLKEQAKKNKVEVKEVKEDGDKATATVANGDKGEEKLSLVKKDGKWLVNMSKDDMGGGAPAAGGLQDETMPEEAPATDTTATIK